MLLPFFFWAATACAQPEDPARAEAAYEAELRSKPTAENWQRLGLARYLQNKYGPAAEAFREALRMDASRWTSRLFLGICQYRTNQFEKALDSLAAAGKLAPSSGPGRDELDYWMGATHIALKQPLAGLKDLERLLSRQPANVNALQLTARTYADLSSGLWNRAAEDYADTAAGWFVHGKALESEANGAGALDAYRQAKALRPSWPGPRLAIGRLLLAQGQPEAALAELREELRLSPGDPEASHYAGVAAAQLNRNEEAARLLNDAAAWFPEAALAQAQVYLALREPGKAAQAARRAAEADPDSEAAHELLLGSLHQAGLAEEAAREAARWAGRKR